VKLEQQVIEALCCAALAERIRPLDDVGMVPRIVSGAPVSRVS
jgi:hypothetical protein